MTNVAAFERRVVDIEFGLSMAAAVPGLGVIPATIKIALGAIQAIGSLVALIVSIPFLWSEKGRNIFCRAGSHFLNGLANIVAGTLEGIPFLGSAIALGRFFNVGGGGHLANGDGRYMIVGYRVLRDVEGQSYSAYGNSSYLPV